MAPLEMLFYISSVKGCLGVLWGRGCNPQDRGEEKRAILTSEEFSVPLYGVRYREGEAHSRGGGTSVVT